MPISHNSSFSFRDHRLRSASTDRPTTITRPRSILRNPSGSSFESTLRNSRTQEETAQLRSVRSGGEHASLRPSSRYSFESTPRTPRSSLSREEGQQPQMDRVPVPRDLLPGRNSLPLRSDPLVETSQASRTLLVDARHKLVDVQSRNEEISRRVQRNEAILKKLVAIDELLDVKEEREHYLREAQHWLFSKTRAARALRAHRRRQQMQSTAQARPTTGTSSSMLQERSFSRPTSVRPTQAFSASRPASVDNVTPIQQEEEHNSDIQSDSPELEPPPPRGPPEPVDLQQCLKDIAEDEKAAMERKSYEDKLQKERAAIASLREDLKKAKEGWIEDAKRIVDLETSCGIEHTELTDYNKKE